MHSSLDALEFTPDSDTKVPGLVRIRGKKGRLSVSEEAAMLTAEDIEGLDFVFFRRFSDGRSSQVAAYVIDNSDERLGEAKLAVIHKEVWLNGSAPLLYVGWPTHVDVLSCARDADFWKKDACRYSPAEKIPVASRKIAKLVSTSAEISDALEKQRRFSALKLSDGTFWDDPRNSDLAHANKAAHRRLIEAVVDTDAAIKGDKNPVLRRLLLLTVLIKYLEDRDVFPSPAWFGKFHAGARSFSDVLEQGTPDEVRRLLATLEQRFNGDIFRLDEVQGQTLTATSLRHFATLVDNHTLRKQRYLWEQRSFRHIPVEVLSHLYQRFAQRGKGAIFTPPFVAALLLDYAMPYDSMTGHERVLDPTCGSGVFLVGAFRRLVNHWRSKHDWRKPDVETLKAILKRSIFGVELQGEALHLAAFSLALAVCDALKPEVIWNELRFDKLVSDEVAPSNLTAGDFFDYAEGQTARFDLCIGNPPFQSELTPAGARENVKAEAVRGTLPDSQVAYLIAEEAMKLLNDGGRMCLIQPSGLFYNENPREFLRRLLSENIFEHVLDFTSMRGLFDKADTKIVAFVARRASPEPNHRIAHLTFRRTFSVEEQIGFELDHYDRHRVLQQQAIAAPFIWKVNLLGGGRLVQLALRLKEMGTFGEFIEQKVEKKKWEYGEGFIAAETGRRDPAPWLTGKLLLPSTALTESGINETRIGEVKATHFRSAYTKERYSAPLMLIRANIGLQCALWERGFLAYKAKVIGIHAPKSQQAALRRIFRQFQENHAALQALCILESTQMLVGRATAPLKRDIDNLPWPGRGQSWDLAPWETTLCEDVVNYMAEYIRLGQDSKLLRDAVTSDGLRAYAGEFCAMLGSIYENLRAGSSMIFNGLACQSFYFGNQPDLDWPDDWTVPLQKLIYIRHGAALRTVRVLRFYESNVILVVKPDRLRYWIRSTAIRDADETLADLRKQGF